MTLPVTHKFIGRGKDLKGYLQETDLKTKAKAGEGVSTPYFAS